MTLPCDWHDCAEPAVCTTADDLWLCEEHQHTFLEDWQKSVKGVAPDAPIVTAPNGAQQSHTPYRFDLIDPRALFVLARILDYGARRYAPNNWRGLSLEDHLNHAAEHLYAHLAGDQQDDHLGHLLARSMMALATAIKDGYQPRQGDERGPTATPDVD